jgi:hypothetical protein
MFIKYIIDKWTSVLCNRLATDTKQAGFQNCCETCHSPKVWSLPVAVGWGASFCRHNTRHGLRWDGCCTSCERARRRRQTGNIIVAHSCNTFIQTYNTSHSLSNSNWKCITPVVLRVHCCICNCPVSCERRVVRSPSYYILPAWTDSVVTYDNEQLSSSFSCVWLLLLLCNRQSLHTQLFQY